MKQRKGFTLVELLAAVVVGIPMLIVLLQIVPGMLKAASQTEVATQATILAQNKTEEIRRLIRSNNPAYGYNHNYFQTATAFPSPNENYKFTVTDDFGRRQKKISITVWKDSDGDNAIDTNEYAVSLNTIVAKWD